VTTTRERVLEVLAKVAKSLGEDLSKVVFVGGVVPALYSQDVDIRPTEDVDCVVSLSRVEYYSLVSRLKERGFKEVLEEGTPVCRMVSGDGIPVDLMPADVSVLGFSNRWYGVGIQQAPSFTLGESLKIKALSPLYFVATKLEAFRSRGRGDFRSSHDLEDLLSVLARRDDVLDEAEKGASDVCVYVREQLASLSESRDFVDAVFGCFRGTDDEQSVALRLVGRLTALHRR
jgi:hypothetical protein